MFKKKAEYVQNNGIMNIGKDYRVYHMEKQDYMVAWGIGAVIGAVVAWAFFSSFLFSIVCAVLCAAFAPRIYQTYKHGKMLNSLRNQFKDLLDSLSASYSAGKNTTNAFLSSEKDMIAIYGDGSDIVQEIRLINGGIGNNINIEALLADFAERSGLDDIKSFAEVFEVCNRQGGNLKKIVTETRDIIRDKIEIEMEIETILAGNKNELNIMIVMPIIVVLMLNGMGSGTVNENTLSNIMLKLFCIGMFVLAYFIGKKLTDIKM